MLIEPRPFVSVHGASYMDPLVSLLDNLPPSLVALDVTLPRFIGLEHDLEFKRSASKRLVRKLCTMMLNKGGCDLDSVVLNKIKLTPQAQAHLTFVFGYRNKVFVKDGKCHMCFS